MSDKKIVTYFEVERPTQHKVKMVNQDCLGAQPVPITKHDMPTLYISKDWFNRVLGGYPVVKITIEAAVDEGVVV